jgi:hypothetical protein
MESPFVARMNEVQASLATLLRPLGFRSKGRFFNRSFEQGVIQVIGLQMGQYEVNEVPLPPEAQRLRPNLYGKFTVNLGVFVHEIYELEAVNPPKGMVKESYCQIRRRLGSSQVAGKDFWWNLDQPTQSIVADIAPMLDADGIPFLERFSTRKAILEQ